MAPHQNCEDCARIWAEYKQSTLSLVQIQSKLQVAQFAHDAGAVAVLSKKVERARDQNTQLRQAMMSHKAAAHNQTPGSDGAVSSLCREVENARQAYMAAVEELNALICEMPSGAPGPDGSYSLELAGKRRRCAFQRYQKALSKMKTFTREAQHGGQDA